MPVRRLVWRTCYGLLAKQVPTPHNTADADWRASLWQILFKFWSDPVMTEDAAIAEMDTAYDSIF